MNLFPAIRWQQRLMNLRKPFTVLQRAMNQMEYNELERAGVVQQFEFCFELSWKSLKDYLNQEGIGVVGTPREVFKEAFSVGLLPNAEMWIEALEHRNLLSHVYDLETAELVITLIRDKYFPLIQDLLSFFNDKAIPSSYGLPLVTWIELLNILAPYPQIEQVLIFGSRAMGNFKPHSDIDLCLKGPLTESQFAKIKDAMQSSPIPYKVDVVHLSTIQEPALVNHIERFGKRVV